MSQNGKSRLDPVDFIPVSKENLCQMRRFCGVPEDRQAQSSPDTQERQSWFRRNKMSGDEPGKPLITCLHLWLASHQNIQHSNIPLFFFLRFIFFFLFDFFTSKSQPRWEEPRAASERQQLTLHQEQGEKKIRAYFQTRWTSSQYLSSVMHQFHFSEWMAHSLFKTHSPERRWIKSKRRGHPQSLDLVSGWTVRNWGR